VRACNGEGCVALQDEAIRKPQQFDLTLSEDGSTLTGTLTIDGKVEKWRAMDGDTIRLVRVDER
jgi:hypothetical protein